MARVANRQNIVKTAAKNRVWLVAFYIRLSREDKRGKDESESITNQRLILTDFLEQQDDGDEYVYVDEYVDDGVSGTTDEERVNFQRLLTDIQKKKINCVIVKNLARSFRNNGDQSYYLGDWFPRNNVRFISLCQQPIDTCKDPQNAQSIAVPVQGVLNEEHARGNVYYYCRTYKDQSKTACTKHTIRHNDLEHGVLYESRNRFLLHWSFPNRLHALTPLPCRKVSPYG